VKEKVLAYIFRNWDSKSELLVFSQPAFPEAGIQVPAGTIEKGEKRIDALLREVGEECGLSEFKAIDFLGSTSFRAEAKLEIHNRHYYQLEFVGQSPDAFEHRVGGKGIDAQMIFAFKWMDLDNLPKLIADQDEFISQIKC